MFRSMLRTFVQQDIPSMAAALTYYTLLSLVPLLLVGFYILAFFPVFHGAGTAIQAFIVKNFVAESANAVAQHLADFMKSIKVLTWPSLIALLVVSILMISNMVHAFNKIWGVKMRRNFALSYLIYLLVLLITPILFASLLLVSSYLASMLAFGERGLAVVRQPLLLVLPYLAAFITFTFLNWVLPSTKVRFTSALLAGLVTTILFECSKWLFSLYFSYFPTYRLIYGALATIPVFLIWVYVSWVVVLVGCLFCVGVEGVGKEVR